MQPYILWFGKFEGSSLEQLMFNPDGYRYLKRFVLKQLVEDPKLCKLVARTKELVSLGENPRIIVKCVCGAVASHIECCDEEADGLEFRDWLCEKCAQKASLSRFHPVELKFSSLNKYEGACAKRFADRLKKACGLCCPITKEKAVTFFFVSPVVKPKSSKKMRQLCLF